MKTVMVYPSRPFPVISQVLVGAPLISPGLLDNLEGLDHLDEHMQNCMSAQGLGPCTCKTARRPSISRPRLVAQEGPKGRAEEPQGPYPFSFMGPALFHIRLLPYFP